MKPSGKHLKGMGRKLNRIRGRMEYAPFGRPASRHLLRRLWHNCRIMGWWNSRIEKA